MFLRPANLRSPQPRVTACNVCRRQARGFGFDPQLARKTGEVKYFCSMRHLKMIDPTQNEIDATKVAREFAGQYLAAIGKTDPATLTP